MTKLVNKVLLSESYERYDLTTKKHHCFQAEGIIVHNSNMRFGLVNDGSGWKYAVGSHHTKRKYDETNPGRYGWPLKQQNVVNLLDDICSDIQLPTLHSVIIFAEMFGPVQDMTYGRTNLDFAVFDIAINGQYMDYLDMAVKCEHHTIPLVPQLYYGSFSKQIVEEYTNGPTTLCPPGEAGKFSGREGIIIKPIRERTAGRIGRLILKSVSADYLARKKPVDNAE